MAHTPLRRLVIHHDAADDNKENIPPSFSTRRTSKDAPSVTLAADFKSWRDGLEHEPHHGTHHSPLKTVYTTLSKSGSRMPLREIFVSSPATPDNAFVEYYIPDTSLVESPIPESPVPRSMQSMSSSSGRHRKPIANRDSRSTTTMKPNKEALAHKSTGNRTSLQRPAPTTAARKIRPALAPKAYLTSSSLAVAAKKSGAAAGMRSLPETASAKPKPKSKLAQSGTKSSGMVLLR
ncbi:hypothetical protein V1508DRAFT_421639 [Lipomyces doorenjongii]|uniref:uncharacterized protein n=1 Tax=Lipomyces doorenjongii TaxID=383834 RepID=UPI0034CFD77C